MLTEEEKNAGLEGKIIPINIEEQMKSAYIDYSMSVIVSRALPDVRDGLKPVHRRILYDMSAELNLYSDKVSSVDELKDGDTVAIPDDLTNGGRALKVLESAGLITLKADAGFSPTVDDIETYNTKIQIEELKANVIPSSLPDVTAAVVNGNYALDFGLKTEEAIYKDSVLDEEQYWNLIAARTADLKDPTKVDVYKKVVAAFQSDATEKVFHDDFGGYFIKVGWDQDLFSEAQ